METYRRSRLEIDLDILAACKTGQKPTNIMYKCNLSWVPCKRALERLVKLGLLRQETVKVREGVRPRFLYHTTPKGLEILDHFESTGLKQLL